MTPAGASITVVEISAGSERARVVLRSGVIAARLLERGPRYARVALVAAGALLLGGDAVELRIAVGEDCTLELEDIGGTVAYDGRGQRASWTSRIEIGDRGICTWHGLPFVVADGADVDRRTVAEFGGDAALLLRETIVLGRAGEAGGSVLARIEIAVQGRPVLVESLDLAGYAPVPGVLGPDRVLDSLLLFGRGHLQDEAAWRTSGMVVLRPERGGVIVRSLAGAAHLGDLSAGWDALRAGLLSGTAADSERGRDHALPG